MLNFAPYNVIVHVSVIINLAEQILRDTICSLIKQFVHDQGPIRITYH